MTVHPELPASCSSVVGLLPAPPISSNCCLDLCDLVFNLTALLPSAVLVTGPQLLRTAALSACVALHSRGVLTDYNLPAAACHPAPAVIPQASSLPLCPPILVCIASSVFFQCLRLCSSSSSISRRLPSRLLLFRKAPPVMEPPGLKRLSLQRYDTQGILIFSCNATA